MVFSCPVVSNSLWPHRLPHTRPPCPSASPKVCPSSCHLHWWCHPALSSFDQLLWQVNRILSPLWSYRERLTHHTHHRNAPSSRLSPSEPLPQVHRGQPRTQQQSIEPLEGHRELIISRELLLYLGPSVPTIVWSPETHFVFQKNESKEVWEQGIILLIDLTGFCWMSFSRLYLVCLYLNFLICRMDTQVPISRSWEMT